MIFILYVFTLLFTIYSIPCESLKCYECTEHVPCGQGQTDLMVDCSGKCMVYRNQYDGGKIIRRCCTNDCGIEDGLENYEGRFPAYFCSEDLCNDGRSDGNLPGEIIDPLSTTTSIWLTTNNVLSSTTTRFTSLSSAQTTTTTGTIQSSFQCYDCLGPDCGKEGSTLAMNCPTCMVYRNRDDQTKIERRCCWLGCGSSYSVSTYNGIQTYFCSYDKCNRYGAETILSPPVTSSIRSTTTTSTTTYSPSSCTLNCKHGGIPEIENGCFCYCFEDTNGRECENINCTQPNDDADICLPENRPLCGQSEIFAYKCLHLCGKC